MSTPLDGDGVFRRSLALGPVALAVEIHGAALAERFDWRYGTDAAAPPPEGWAAPARIVLEARDEGPSLPNAWQPELSSRRKAELLELAFPAARGSFDLARRVGTFSVRSDVRGFGLALDDLLRVVGLELAMRDGVLLVHAAAVGPAGSDWVDLFPGRSDAGKTTLTEKLVARGETAISDDLVFVAVRDGTPTALPTPFKGATRARLLRRETARVRTIAFLRQADASACRELGGPERLVRLLSAVVRYRPLDPPETERMTVLAAEVAARCRLVELSLALADDPRGILST